MFLLAYVSLCSALRFRFEKAMRNKFNYPDRASLAKMTNDDAQAILDYIITREFPYLYNLSLQFALFKVCPFAATIRSLDVGGLIRRAPLPPLDRVADLQHPYYLPPSRKD